MPYITSLLKTANLFRDSLLNYRPITRLTFALKLLERIGGAQLDDHFVANYLHAPAQSAYRPRHSTETALVRLLNDTLLDLDKVLSVIVVYLDICAPFDTVDHRFLLSMLHDRFFKTNNCLDWFSYY